MAQSNNLLQIYNAIIDSNKHKNIGVIKTAFSKQIIGQDVTFHQQIYKLTDERSLNG